MNNNGVLDATEPTRTTSATGAYSFGGLVPGTYTVRQVVPAGLVATSPVGGGYAVQVVDGQTYGGRDFGTRLESGDSNDQLTEAFPMTVGSAASGTIGDGGAGVTDVDTFSFSVVAGQRVAFTVSDDGDSALESYLRVFDGSGAQLAASGSVGAASQAEYTFAAAGTYYVSVSGNPNRAYDPLTGTGDAAGSTGAYVISLDNRTIGADTDDQLGEATATGIGDTVAGESISTGGDVDLYQFVVSAGQRVGFDVDRTVGSAIDSYLRVFDATGRQLGANDNGAAPGEPASLASYLEVTFPTAGTYYVGVSASPNKSYHAATGGADVFGRGGGYSLTLNDVPVIASATATRTAGSTRGLFSDVPVAVTGALAAQRAAGDLLQSV